MTFTRPLQSLLGVVEKYLDCRRLDTWVAIGFLASLSLEVRSQALHFQDAQQLFLQLLTNCWPASISDTSVLNESKCQVFDR